MTGKEEKVKNIIIYIIPNIASVFLPIITLPIFTRILTKNDYGIYALAEIYAILLSGIANFGLTLSYERNFFQYQDKRKASELFYSTLIFVLVAFLIATVFTYVFKKPMSKIFIGSEDYGFLLLWVFLARGVASFKQYFLIYFKNSTKAKDFTIYTINETFLAAALSLFFVAYLKIGIIGFAWGQCFASIIILLFLVLRFLKEMPFYFGWGVLKESLKISLPLTPRIFLGVIGTHFNKYIVSILNTMGGVGVLSIAQKISNMTFMFMTALQNVFSPHVYKLMFSSKLSADKEIGKYLTSFVYISTFVCLLLSLFSKEALWILTGPSFYEAAPLISILSVYYGFQFFGKINGIQLIYKKKTAITSLLTVVNIIVGVVISIPLVMNFGVIGSVWATFLVSLIVGGTAFIIAQRYFYVHWETKKIMAIFGMLCFSGLLALFTMSDLVIYSVALILKLLCVGVYLFLGAKFCIVTRGNIKLLWDIVTFKKNKIVVNATL